MLSNWTKLKSLNTTQVKELIKHRFGGSLKQVYLNKCYSNKQEIGCKRIKLHTAFLRGMQSGAWLRLQHVNYNK